VIYFDFEAEQEICMVTFKGILYTTEHSRKHISKINKQP